MPRWRIVLAEPVVRGLLIALVLSFGILQVLTFAKIARTTVTVRRMADFSIFYASAKLAAVGKENPYDVAALARTADGIRTPNLNPPHALLLLIPLTWVERRIALVIWLFASVCSAFIACRIIFREAGIAATPMAVAWAVVILACAAPTGALLMFFQVSWLLWAPVTWAWALARHGRWKWAAVVLGAAMSIKPFLALFVPVFLWRKQWTAAAVTSITAAASFAAGIAVLGWQTFLSWMRAVASVVWMDHIFNASIFGFFDRLFTDRGILRVWDLAPFARRPELATLLAMAGAATIFCASMWAVRPDHASDRLPAQDSAVEIDRMFAVTLTASLLISPLGWIYYHFLPAAPMVALFFNKQWRTSPQWRTWLLAIGAICLMLSPGLLASGQPNGWATASIGSAYFWGSLAFWVCALTPAKAN